MILKWYGNIGASRNRHYENVPFEIPLNWVWAKGYDIFHPMESTKPQGEFFNYIDIDAIDNVRNVVSCPKHLLCKDAPSRATRRVSKGDVLFSMVRPYLRNIAKVEIDDCIASTGFYVCKTNGTITCDYCYYMMISNYVVDGLNHFMKGDNSPSINNDNILSWLYPIPPLTEQQRIVLEIERWFYLIDNLEDSKSDLKDFVIKTKSKVLDLAIHGKLVEQDPNDEPASELLKRIAPNATLWDNSHYGQSPQSWCVVKLGDIGKWQAGGTPKRSIKEYYGGDIPWLKTGDLNDGFITDIPEYITQAGLNNSSAKLNPRGSVLVAMYGATIGKMGILTFPATTNQACCACIEHPVVETMYLFYFLLSHRDIFISQGGGGAQPNISKEIIINTHIPLPPLAEQMRIVSKVSELLNLLDKITAEL